MLRPLVGWLSLATGLTYLALTGCTLGKAVVMVNPQTSQVFECKGERMMNGKFQADECAQALERQGWKKVSEREW